MENYKVRRQVFIDAINANYKPDEINLIIDSCNFAEFHHANQKRKSGEPFMIHPLETAIKLVE